MLVIRNGEEFGADLRATKKAAQLPRHTEPSKTMPSRSHPLAHFPKVPQPCHSQRKEQELRAPTTHSPCLSPAVPEPDLLVIVATDDDVVPAHHVITVGKHIDGPGT